VGFVVGGLPDNLDKNPGENQQQSQVTYDTGLESNSDHIGLRCILSPLCHPYYSTLNTYILLDFWEVENIALESCQGCSSTPFRGGGE